MNHKNYYFTAIAVILIFAFSGLCVLEASAANSEPPQNPQIKLDALTLDYIPYIKGNPNTGILCAYDGVPLSIGNWFYVSNANQKKVLIDCYNPEDFKVSIQSRTENAKSLVLKFRSSEATGYVSYTIRRGNILDIDFAVTISKQDGWIGFDALRIAPSLIAGLPFNAKLKNGETVNREFPCFQKTEQLLPAISVRDFTEMSIDSRLGNIVIQKLGDSNSPVQIADWRKKQWHPRPCFDLSIPLMRAKAGVCQRLKLRIRFPQSPLKITPTVKHVASDKWTKCPVVIPIINKHPQLFPTPKKVAWMNGSFSLSPNTSLVFKNILPQDRDKLVAILNRSVAGKCGFMLKENPGTDTNGRIELILSKDLADKGPEYYELTVTTHGVKISASQPIGLRDGIMTLSQLLCADAEGRPSLLCADISDWPSLSMRGVHCFSGKAKDLQVKYVERIFSACKLNNVVYECGYVKWDSAPFAHSIKYGMEKEQAAQVVSAIKDNYIQPIPLIQSMGHIDWLNRNVVDKFTGRRAYGEYMVSPTAFLTCFNPLNDKGITFLENLYDEVIEMFQPQYFHIGFDECLVGDAQLDALSKTSGVAADELFLKQLLAIKKYMKARNIQPIIWGDALLLNRLEASDYGHAPSKAAAEAMRKRVPKDIIIADWHYGSFTPEKYISVNILQDAGFKVLGSTWFYPGNLIWFNTALKKAKSLGHLQTTWAGFSFDETGLDKLFSQFYSHMLGAEAAWNGDYATVENVPFNMDEKFVEMWTKNDFLRFMKSSANNWYADISGVANVQLPAPKWLGMNEQNALPKIRELASDNVKFQVTGDGRISEAVLFDSKYKCEPGSLAKLVLDVNKKLDTLIFIQASSFQGEWDEAVADYTISYDDGSKYTVPLRYGRNIFWYAETQGERPWDNHNNPLVWNARTSAGENVSARYLKVDNPYPEKIIKNITIETEGKGPGLILFGLAGLGAE